MQNASLPADAELLNEATLEHKAALEHRCHNSTLEHRLQRAKRKCERQNSDHRRNKCFRTLDTVPFNGKHAYIAQEPFNGKHAYIAQEDLERMSSADTALDSFLQRLCAHFVDCGLRLADHPMLAAGGLFVVMDAAKPTLSILLVAILTGGSVMDPLYLFARRCIPGPPRRGRPWGRPQSPPGMARGHRATLRRPGAAPGRHQCDSGSPRSTPGRAKPCCDSECLFFAMLL